MAKTMADAAESRSIMLCFKQMRTPTFLAIIAVGHNIPFAQAMDDKEKELNGIRTPAKYEQVEQHQVEEMRAKQEQEIQRLIDELESPFPGQVAQNTKETPHIAVGKSWKLSPKSPRRPSGKKNHVFLYNQGHEPRYAPPKKTSTSSVNESTSSTSEEED